MSRASTTHPDLLDATEDAELLSAVLNKARQCLLNPESRAQELLRILAPPETMSDTSLPEGFLMDIMDARMGMEMALSSEDVDEIERWRVWAQTQRTGYMEQVGGMFESLPSIGDAEIHKKAHEIKQTLNAWRYIERMRNQLDEHMDITQ